MRKNILFIIIFACVLCCSTKAWAWGPKFKLHFENEVGDYSDVFIGVDSNATDGLDEGIAFQFGDTSLKESYDLPPPPAFYIYMIRDTLDEFNTHSYADVRSIPKNISQFRHRYIAKGNYPMMTDAPQLIITWDNLPAGIDSAKIGSNILSSTSPVNMLTNNQIAFENLYGGVSVYVDIWYNKENFDTVREAGLSFISPQPASNFITIHNIDVKRCRIYDILGNELQTVVADSSSNTIEISRLYPGFYNLKVEQVDGNIKHFSFIKN